MNYLYLDLETTGLLKNNSIIELAASFYKEGKLVSSFYEKCNAGDQNIDLEALKLNKTKFKDLNSRCSEKELIQKFCDWLLSLDIFNVELAGVNVHFDYNFLKNRAEQYNIVLGSVLPYRLYDISQDIRTAVKLGLLTIQKSGKGNSLLDAAKALKLEFEEKNLHSAKGDVDLYVKVHKEIEKIFKQAMCSCNKTNIKAANE